MNASELSARLAENAATVAEMLLPKGKRHGAEWKAGSVEGDAGQSLSVRLTGDKRGLWSDFATGQSGDLLDLWVESRSVSLADAIRDAKEYLCIVDIMPSRERRPYVRPEKPRCVRPKNIVLEWLHARGFEDRTIEAFKVGASGDDTVVLPYIRDGVFVNVKHHNIHDKSKMWQAKDAEPCLFGWHTIGDKSREVAICEGEFDCMALWQSGIEALSVNQGAGNHQWIDSDWDRLDSFSKIYLCFDDDAAGKKGVAEVATRLGLERCFVVTFPEKDANDYMKAGASEDDFRSCFKRAATFDPEELVRASAFEDDVVRAFYPPDDAPTDPLLRLGSDHAWFRFRSGEVSVWTGFNGHGKSLVLGQIILGLLSQDQQACIFSGEMLPTSLLKRMTRQATGFAEPAIPFIRKVARWFNDRLWLFNLTGSAESARLLFVFTYAARRYGIRTFVIDSLMMVSDIPEEGKGALEAQRQFMRKISDFAKRYKAHVHLVAHPRKGADEKTGPGKQDTAGSGKITDMADNHWSVWANLRDENEPADDGPDAYLELNKQRHEESQHRKLWLWYDPGSQQYRSLRAAKPMQFVEWSPSEYREEA